MDIVEVISEKTTAIALALTVMYFYNKLVADVLIERKEMLDVLRAERKEWIETSHNHIDALFALTRTNVETMVGIRSEMHALRNRLTETLLKDRKPTNDGSTKD